MSNNFDEILKKARRDKGITQEELAAHLNVSRQTISNWERGQGYPESGKTLKEICDYLEIDTNLLRSEDLYEIFNINEIIAEKERKLKRKNRVVYIVVAIVLVIVAFTLWVVYNSNMFSLYNVSIDSEYFTLDNSVFAYSKNKIYFQLGTLTSNLENTDENTNYEIEIYQKRNGKKRLIYESIYMSNIVIMEDYGNNEYFDNDFIEYLDDVYIDIKFSDDDNELQTFTLKLNFYVYFKSDLIFYVISNKNRDSEKSTLNDELTRRNHLIRNGYIFNNKTNNYEKSVENGVFYFNYKNYSLNYTYNYESYEISLSYYINGNKINGKILHSKNKDYYDNFEYNLNSNKFVCTLNKCENYKKYVKLILNEYEILK